LLAEAVSGVLFVAFFFLSSWLFCRVGRIMICFRPPIAVDEVAAPNLIGLGVATFTTLLVTFSLMLSSCPSWSLFLNASEAIGISILGWYSSNVSFTSSSAPPDCYLSSTSSICVVTPPPLPALAVLLTVFPGAVHEEAKTETKSPATKFSSGSEDVSFKSYLFLATSSSS